MVVHYHWKGIPYTVRSGERGFSTLFGFRVVDRCERCGFTTNEYYDLEGAYLCDNCYTETMRIVSRALDQSFVLYE